MKRFLALILAVSVTTASVFASEITVILDGSEVEFSAQEPVIEEGRTLIPLRGVFEQLGYEISWDGDTKTAEFSNGTTVIAITANSGTFTVNDRAVDLDVPASIINGSMMLPLRAVGEAAGLEVEWNSDTKTVNLSSSSADEETTEETTGAAAEEAEETTEEATEPETETAAEVIEDDISEADLTKLKNCVNSESTLYSIDALSYLLDETVDYAYYKINGALEYSYSVSELVEVFDDAITECKGYKTAANNLKTLTDDQNTVKKFVAYVDLQIEGLQFFYDLFCSVKYSSASEKSIQSKIDTLEKNISESIDDFSDAFDSLADKCNEVVSIEKYNAEVSDNITDSQKKGMESYRKEIGEYVTEQINTIKNSSDSYRNGSVFVTAATNIRNKINSTPAPQYCLLDKQCMLRACDLITQAGTAIKNGAYTKDGKNEYFIEYLSVMSAGNILFTKSLGDYYNPTEGDFIEIEDEVEIDIDIEESGDSVTV